VLLRLIEYLGNPNPLVNGLAYDEVSSHTHATIIRAQTSRNLAIETIRTFLHQRDAPVRAILEDHSNFRHQGPTK
jgi:hypothetical protein